MIEVKDCSTDTRVSSELAVVPLWGPVWGHVTNPALLAIEDVCYDTRVPENRQTPRSHSARGYSLDTLTRRFCRYKGTRCAMIQHVRKLTKIASTAGFRAHLIASAGPAEMGQIESRSLRHSFKNRSGRSLLRFRVFPGRSTATSPGIQARRKTFRVVRYGIAALERKMRSADSFLDDR